MIYHVVVSFGKEQEYEFKLPDTELAGRNAEEARRWFDKEFTDKQGSVDAEDSANARTLEKSPVCKGTESGFAQQSCCPEDADVPAGVRCARYRFVP